MILFCILLTATTILWGISLHLKDASIADLMWGMFFVIQGIVTYLNCGTGRSMLLMILTSIWGIRLSVYLGVRNHHKPEDRRYQDMRRHHGSHFWWRSYFTVFVFQMLIAWFVGMPQRLGGGSGDFQVLDYVGVILWFVGFVFEVVSDWQLSNFLKDGNRTEVLDTGLWRYSRHPNYFGDALLWWGFGLIGLSGSGQYWILLSPLVMTGLLLKISGVALMEKKISHRRPNYQRYIEQTSAFIPWFPKSTD